jgi:hypothetical protein
MVAIARSGKFAALLHHTLPYYLLLSGSRVSAVRLYSVAAP